MRTAGGRDDGQGGVAAGGPSLADGGQRPEKAAEGLGRLALLYERPAPALTALEPLVQNERMAAALAELRQLCALMEQRGLAEHLRLDFSIANDMNYYSGVMFRGFVPGLAAGVLADTCVLRLLVATTKKSKSKTSS